MNLKRAVPVVHVTDVDAAVTTYAKALGLEVLMDHGWIATLGTEGVAQFSLLGTDPTAPEAPEMSLEVDDVDAAHASVVASGLRVVHPLSPTRSGAYGGSSFRTPTGTS